MSQIDVVRTLYRAEAKSLLDYVRWFAKEQRRDAKAIPYEELRDARDELNALLEAR